MRSPTTTAGTLVLARGMTGMIEQSATKALSSPCTRPRASVTAIGLGTPVPWRRSPPGGSSARLLLDPVLQRRASSWTAGPGVSPSPSSSRNAGCAASLPRRSDAFRQHRPVVSLRISDVAVIDPRFTDADRWSAT